MNRTLRSATGLFSSIRIVSVWAIAITLYLAASSTPMQGQQSNSLGDAARQARTQKQAVPQASDNQAQQIADQLSEEQNSGDAPGGFKTYNAGDYKVWVPAPYTVDGHDEGGTVVSGPTVGSKRTLVLLGTPMVFAWGGSDAAFHDAATQFASLYLSSAKCTKTTLRSHDAYQCGLAGANLMGRPVSGNAMFVRVGGSIYPIFCAAPTDSHERDILNNPRSSYEDKLYARAALDREEVDVRNVWQKCDTVFQSLRVKEGDARKAAQPGQTSRDSSAPAAGPEAAAGAAPAASTGDTASAAGSGSLADVARRLRQDPGQAAKITAPAPAAASAPAQTTVPAGFKVHAFQYCNGPRQCWDASVLVPVDAQLISSDCKQYVFEIKVQGSPLLLMSGSASGDCDKTSGSDHLVRWHQLVDPENKRAPGTFVTISSQQTRLDGQTAVITTMGFKRGMADWMGKRAEVEANSVPLVVGCMAPRDHFADGDAICSALIGSLRLP